MLLFFFSPIYLLCIWTNITNLIFVINLLLFFFVSLSLSLYYGIMLCHFFLLFFLFFSWHCLDLSYLSPIVCFISLHLLSSDSLKGCFVHGILKHFLASSWECEVLQCLVHHFQTFLWAIYIPWESNSPILCAYDSFIICGNKITTNETSFLSLR